MVSDIKTMQTLESIEKILTTNQKAIIKEWFNKTVQAYPSQTAHFLKSENNQFANPVGQLTQNGLEKISDYLLQKQNNNDTLQEWIDPIIRVRAIQNFSPSQAIGFMFILKDIVRNQIKTDFQIPIDYIISFDQQIDKLALYCFDIYMACRDKLNELKVNEFKRQSFRLYEKSNKRNE